MGKMDTNCNWSIEQRTKRPGIPHSSGAKQPLYNSASGKIEIHVGDSNEDLCACEYRKLGSRGRKKCKCAKPQCQDEYFNPNGKCQDPRRCRTSRRVFNPDKIIPC